MNFDANRVAALVSASVGHRERIRAAYEVACAKAGKTPERLAGPAAFVPATDTEGLVAQGREIAIPVRLATNGADLTSLQEIMTYGVKGTAAYAYHAMVLGREDDAVYAGIHEALDALADNKPQAADLIARSLDVGALNLRVMELLDAANTAAFGHPVPTEVAMTPRTGKAILVSGHDLRDLGELLRQTEGKGVDVYTHGEMLPAHGYPELKKFGHLAGNWGGAWQEQALDFAAFPGAILMTSNCIQQPQDSYSDRIFTTGPVAWPGVRHVADGDYAPVIEAALAAPGFAEDAPRETVTVGFGHNAVLGVAGAVIDAVKAGQIRHFFLIGGCDGARPGRNYFTEMADAVPEDCVVLTLGCGKYRFNRHEFGAIGGIPRLLDIGQCNDAFSAIRIAQALAGAFGVGMNDLPLTLVISWYEQKAVAVLLTLLHLGIRNIRLGPTLPQFVTPTVLDVLVKEFNLMPVTTPEDDLAAILAA